MTNCTRGRAQVGPSKYRVVFVIYVSVQGAIVLITSPLRKRGRIHTVQGDLLRPTLPLAQNHANKISLLENFLMKDAEQLLHLLRNKHCTYAITRIPQSNQKCCVC